MSKILYLFDATDWDSRIEVARKARENGHEVVIGLIGGDDHAQGKAPDFKIMPLKKSNRSIGLLSSLDMVFAMRKMMRSERPDILHAVTLKYGFMAGTSALGLGLKRKIFTLAGLGYLFRSDDKKSLILRFALTPFLKFIFKRRGTTLIFQNSDDLELFVHKNFIAHEDAVLIKGSGVYLDRFNKNETDRNENNAPVVLMPTRLVHEKGVAVFIEAARLLKTQGVDAVFQIAGGETKHNPKAISTAQMQDMIACGSVQWLGRVDDLHVRLQTASVIVYPSYYGEGIPRVLLEACAAGCAIVTTDHPGCREAVDHGENGLLVPVKDVHKTAAAIADILSNDDMRRAMEQRSREKAEKEFDIHSIAEQTARLYEDI